MNNDQRTVRVLAEARVQESAGGALWCQAMWSDELDDVPAGHVCWLVPNHPADQKHECLCGAIAEHGVSWPAAGTVGVGSASAL